MPRLYSTPLPYSEREISHDFPATSASSAASSPLRSWRRPRLRQLPRCPPASHKAQSIEGITEYTLTNGLRVLLFPDETKPTVTVNVTYLVGSRYENYGETGMAHLLEHLMFKGTPSIASVFQELSRRGMRFNGSTSFDRTNYFETFTASDENLDWALRMEADRW
jgi:zinc protease